MLYCTALYLHFSICHYKSQEHQKRRKPRQKQGWSAKVIILF